MTMKSFGCKGGVLKSPEGPGKPSVCELGKLIINVFYKHKNMRWDTLKALNTNQNKTRKDTWVKINT
jgi:hypothetical protein